MGFNLGFKGLMKIRPEGAELFHAGGRTDGQSDMRKLIVTFRNFVKPIGLCNGDTIFF